MKVVESFLAVCKEAGIQHYVWSTLEDTTEFFDSLPEEERVPKIDGYYVPHFDTKGQANALFPQEKTTCLYTSFFMDNLASPQMVQNGVFSSNMADVPMSVIAVEDIGNCAYEIFKAGDKYKGQSVYIAGDVMSLPDLAQLISEATGMEFRAQSFDRDVYAGFFPGADDIANMYEYYKKNKEDFIKKRSVDETKKLYPGLLDARAWINSHLEQLRKVGPAKASES
jgi:NmrA-like family